MGGMGGGAQFNHDTLHLVLPKDSHPPPPAAVARRRPSRLGVQNIWCSSRLGAAFPASLTGLTYQEGVVSPSYLEAPGVALGLHSPLAQHPPHPAHRNPARTCLALFHLQPPCVLGSFSSFHTGGKKGQNKVSPTAAGWVPGCQLGPDSALVRARTGASTPVFPSELGAGLHKQRPWGTGGTSP